MLTLMPVSFSNIFFICSQMTTSAEQMRLRLPAACAEKANEDTPADSAATRNAERIVFLPLYGASTPTLLQACAQSLPFMKACQCLCKFYSEIIKNNQIILFSTNICTAMQTYIDKRKRRPKPPFSCCLSPRRSADSHQAGIATSCRGVDRSRNFFQQPVETIGIRVVCQFFRGSG